MANKVWEEGFVVGMNIGGGSKASTGIAPISFSNGLGIYWSTYVTITFNLPLNVTNMNANYLAFTITGKELGVSKSYTVTGVTVLDNYRIAIACADYKNLDDYIAIHYDKTLGNLASADGQVVNTFDGSFAPLYMMPKVNVAMVFLPPTIAKVVTVALQSPTDVISSAPQVPLTATLSEIYSPIPFTFPTINLVGTLAGSITAVTTP